MSQPPPPAPTSEQDSVPEEHRDRSWREMAAGLPRAVRWPAYALAAVLVVLVLLVATVFAFTQRPLPETGGTVEVPGLAGEVEVVRDDHGIAQIYADTDLDLARAQGWVQASERFFEMDVRRHITAGRLAELFGADAVETDRFVRTMGWRRVAEKELALVTPETREMLSAYAEGVNAYLEERGPTELGVEYALLAVTGLDYTPEPWTEVDSLAWLKAMAWDLRGNMDEEIERVTALVDHSPREVAELFPAYDTEARAPIVEGGGVVDGVFEQDASGNATRNPRRPGWSPAMVRALQQVGDRAQAMPELVGRGSGVGSNSWVVDGDHSSTGQPLLANDPHLSTSQPGIWMQMGLHCREITPDCTLDVAGFTFSGVPGVVIGHNADIAWGFTNLGPDVTDLYLERIEGEEWVHGRERLPLSMRRETIKVRGGDDVELTVRSTDHGPLLSDVSQELSSVGANAPVRRRDAGQRGSGYAVALQWTALDPQPTADAILGLNRAGDWDEFRAAAAQFAVPSQNLVYADREGHIGYQAPGRIPIRKSGNDGRWPSEGWLPENDWTGEVIPFDGLPSVLDPEEGFIATANQQVIDESYPWHLTRDWDQGYRAERIRDVLETQGEMSVDKMADLQLDTVNPMAAVLVPYLLDVRDLPSGYYAGGQDLLADWDFTQPADSAPAAYYNVVWRHLLELTFHDELSERVWPDGGDRWFAVVSRLLREPAADWWDDTETEDEVETRDDILRRALVEARDELTRTQALDPRQWSWGALHRMDLHNATLGESGIGPVEWLVNRDGAEVGGGSAIVDATSWDAAEGYEVTAAPSMRMVVSVADWDESRWINLTGVSGHPGSDHYDDQTEMFVEGDYLPWAFDRDAVDAAADDVLTLEPGAED